MYENEEVEENTRETLIALYSILKSAV